MAVSAKPSRSAGLQQEVERRHDLVTLVLERGDDRLPAPLLMARFDVYRTRTPGRLRLSDQRARQKQVHKPLRVVTAT
jgi:hypothetical protein